MVYEVKSERCNDKGWQIRRESDNSSGYRYVGHSEPSREMGNLGDKRIKATIDLYVERREKTIGEWLKTAGNAGSYQGIQY